MPDGDDIIIVSDLHLSAGKDPDAGTDDCDATFGRFLNDFCLRANKEGRRWRLVVLGDLCDFLQTEVGLGDRVEHRIDTSADTALLKLERIVDEHHELFAALGRFVAAGFPLHIVLGNHDIELIRGSAQDRFKELVARHSGQPEAASGITFYPWIYYVPGVLYAEHGQQYHDINSFDMLLWPHRDQNLHEIRLPLGSHFDRYLFHLRKAVEPVADTERLAGRSLRQVFCTYPFALLRSARYHLRFARVILAYAVGRSIVTRGARAYRENVLRSYADDLGLSHATLLAIHQFSAISAGATLRRLAGKGFNAALRKMLPRIARLTRSANGELVTPRHGSRPSRSAAQPPSYLARAALIVDRLLHTEHKNVPYYVFGHTHAAEHIPIGNDLRPAHYLNTGAWTSQASHAADGPGRGQRLTFVQITHEREGPTPIARLLMWDDAAGCHELLSSAL